MTVLVFIVTYVLGGPAQVVNFVLARWSIDLINSVVNWVSICSPANPRKHDHSADL